MTFRSVVAPALAPVLIGALAACGGSSSSKGTTPGVDNRTSITAGVLVDPYIEGGVLQELTLPARKLVQESTVTGATGAFAFELPLTRGNVVVLSVKGLHNGAPYTVRLERLVDVTSGSFVVSPLTTLLASGKTPTQVIDSLDPALASSLSPADLTADPMARAQSALDKKGRQLLAASIAVGGALQLVGGNAASADVPAAASAIGARVLEALGQTSDVGAGASAGSAVADYIARASTPATVGSVAGGFDAGLITSLVQTAVDSGAPVGLGDAGGGLVVTANPGTLENHLEKGLAALQAGLGSHATDDFLLAANELSAAATLAAADGATAAQNDLDKARFFGGLARVVLLAQPYSDSTDNGLNDLGDILDAFGLAAARTDRATFEPTLVLTCQTTTYSDPYGGTYTGESCKIRPIATNSPRSGQLQTFLSGQLAASLRRTVELLSGVSATFQAQLTDGARFIDFDRTDALFLKGVAQGMIALIELQQGYNLDVDLHAEQTRADTTSYKLGQFLTNNPSFLRLSQAASVQASRVDALASIDTFLAALASLRAEPLDQQANDLVKVADENCYWDPVVFWTCTTVYNAQDTLADAEYALTTMRSIALASGNVTIDGRTPQDPTDDALVNPSAFFAGIDLRALLPARFDLGPTGDRPGMFPDPTFGGVVVQWPAGQSPNTDLDGDGLPDKFGGYTQFGGWLPGATLWNYGGVQIVFAASGNGFTVYDNHQYPPATYTGTYAYSGQTLTFTFSGPGPMGAARTVLVAQEFWDGAFNTETTHYGADGGVLQVSWDSWTIGR